MAIDPTPGDPVLVLSGGREYLEVAAAINGAASAMTRLDVDGAVSAAVDALVEARDDTIGQIRKAHARYTAAGDALITYAGVLDTVQSDTARALEAARAAFDEQADATRTRTYYTQLAEVETDPVARATYLQHADLAADTLTTSQQVMARAQREVTTAVDVRDRAAEHAADHIHHTTASDGLDDSWWDNWGSKIVAAIADVADLVSQITGTLAMVVAFIPVVGQALAGALLVITAVTAITSALANIALAATGKRTWAQAGVAVASAALSTLGLGTAARAATGISKTALAAGTRQSATGLKNLGTSGLQDGATGLDRQPVCKVSFGTCFTAGTLVATPDGDRPIEDLRAGDVVHCYDQTTGTRTIETIEETFARPTTTLIHLTIAGHVLTTTPEHPFMVHGLGWIQATDLHPGDLLITADERHATVDAIETKTADASDAVTVYNLHVHTHHTYYVLAGNHPVLVHNMAGHNGIAPTASGERARFISDQRRTHILDGDVTGGGHRWPGGPGKSPFPREWSDDEIMEHVSNVVTDPRSTWSEGGPGGALFTRTGRPARFVVVGERQGVRIKVVTAPAGEGIVTAYPVGGAFVGS
ncbi:polymorphic toxin-type HINT domain-containing protein [Luteimicrobium xylanilyticum]|uniref:polymorphic toxin-type HINT domain-containing protein n=1 Tax=Luteimicrobium xylanilyticum TaxID=1133546 RepID=UPI0011D1AE0C|nr:polymorphic toxin-type HINT domain-containing protein [Luteimicrobium xylanilyticum]